MAIGSLLVFRFATILPAGFAGSLSVLKPLGDEVVSNITPSPIALVTDFPADGASVTFFGGVGSATVSIPFIIRQCPGKVQV